MRIMRINRPSDRRHGMTLYEVVLSIAIFFVAMTGISQLVSIGSNSAISAKLETEAVMHCESKLNEVIAGAIPMEDVSDQPLVDGDPSWMWSLTAKTDQPATGIVDLTVTVYHQTNQGKKNAMFTMRRFVRDPQVFIDAAEAAAAKEAEAAEEAAGLESTTGN